jgi:hypothetical protein
MIYDFVIQMEGFSIGSTNTAEQSCNERCEQASELLSCTLAKRSRTTHRGDQGKHVKVDSKILRHRRSLGGKLVSNLRPLDRIVVADLLAKGE